MLFPAMTAGYLLARAAVPRAPVADRVLPRCDGAAPRRLDHAGRHDRAALSPLRAPAPERRARRVGARAGGAGDPARAGRLAPRVPLLAALGLWVGQLRALASPVALRRRAAPPVTRCSISSTRSTSARACSSGGRSCTASHAPGAKAAYLFAAFVLASPIGLVLALVPEPIYDFYADGPGLWGLSPITDQEIAGVTMAVEQAIVFFAAFAYFFTRFFAEQDAAAGEATRELRTACDLRTVFPRADSSRSEQAVEDSCPRKAGSGCAAEGLWGVADRAPEREPGSCAVRVGAAGFEPATSRSQSERATRLRHAPSHAV